MKLKWSGKRTLIAAAVVLGVGYLYVQGEDARGQQGPASSDTTQCRVASTVDGLNVRSAPALDPANVVDQLAAGEEADAVAEVQNGFRKLGDGRWVSVEYTQPVEGAIC